MSIQIDKVNVPLDELNIRNNFHIQNTVHPIKKFVIKDAIEVSHKYGGLPIYACDKVSKTLGAKVFYTGSYDQFWSMYNSIPSSERCFYETILPENPCHLYIDMEGDINPNLEINYVDLSLELLNELTDFIAMFSKSLEGDLIIKKEDIVLVELDSSSDKKFSKHYIVKIKNNAQEDGYIMFYNNFHCGALMRRFQKYIVQMHGGVDNNKFFHDHTSQRTEINVKNFLIDMGVYTLRRQFRLIGSAKRTQASKRREIWIPNQPRKLTKQSFLDCLVQYIPFEPNGFEKNKPICLLKIHELNGSEATSSSLKSFDKLGNPISIAANTNSIRHNIGDTAGSAINKWATKCNEVNNKNKRKVGDDTILPISLQDALKKYYKDKWDYSICGYIIGDDKIKLETYDRRCMNKKRRTKNEEEHKFNHIYFVVFTNTLYHIQGCYDDTYCVDIDTGKKSYTKLGRIEDENVIKEVSLWKNGYDGNYAESWTDIIDDEIINNEINHNSSDDDIKII
jgi:hypothetical protein